MKRPFLVSGLSFFITAFIASYFNSFFLSVGIVLSAAAFLIFLIATKNYTAKLAALCAVLAFAEMLVFNCTLYAPGAELDGKTDIVNATVIDEPSVSGNRYRYTAVADDGCGFTPAGTKFIVSTPKDVVLDPFDTFSGKVNFYLPNESSGFNARAYYKSNGIYIAAYTSYDLKYTGTADGFKFQKLSYGVRRFIRDTLSADMSRDNAALLTAITDGDKSMLSDELNDAFKYCGISHIAVVSGLHISIVMSAFLFLFIRLGINRRGAAIITCLPVAAFVILSGMAPAAVRSGIMCVIFLVSVAAIKKSDGLNSLGFSVLVMLAVNPFQVRNISFLLSFLATFGILVLGTRFTRWKIFKGKEHRKAKSLLYNFVGIISQTVSATIFTLPVTVFVFGYLSVISPIANVIIIPILPLMMICCLVGLLLSAVHLAVIAKPFLFIASLFSGYINKVALLLGRKDLFLFPMNSDFIKIGFVLSAIIVVVAYLLNKKHKKTLKYAIPVAAVVFVSAMWISQIYKTAVTDISVLPAGNGLCMVITDDKGSYIVGCGGDYSAVYSCNSKIGEDITNNPLLFVLPRNDYTFGQNARSIIEDNDIKSLLLSSYGDKLDYNWKNKDIVFADSTVEANDNRFVLFETDKFSALKVTADGVKLLVLSRNADISALPDDFRDAKIIVTAGTTVPKGLNLCTADTAVISADNKKSLTAKTLYNVSGLNCYATSGKTVTIRAFDNGRYMISGGDGGKLKISEQQT